MASSSKAHEPLTEYRTYRITMPVLRKKMPQAILKALTDARLIRKTKDAATVLEIEPEAATGFIQIPMTPNQSVAPVGITWIKVPGAPGTTGGVGDAV